MIEKIRYTRKSFSVVFKLKSEKGELWKSHKYYPSGLADSYPMEQYATEIWPQECLMYKGKPVNCKGLVAALDAAILLYRKRDSRLI